MILKTLKFNLEDLADNIFTACNGVEALATLNEQDIHCIVCDINMPKMNGVEVIKAIRENKDNTPFIFYTGHGNQELMLEAVKYGAFDFLNKPNLDGLEDVVSRGLKEGFRQESHDSQESEDFISDYQKLLKQLDQKS